MTEIGVVCLEDLNPSDLVGKTIFIRVDFNVPLASTDKGYFRVRDDTRIRRFLDLTFKKIHQLTDGDCRLIIGSHLGRPQKKKNHTGWDGIFNMQFVSSHFDTLLRKEYGDIYTVFPPEVIDSHMKLSLEICSHHRLPKGGIKFLPNLRYLLDPKNPKAYSQEFMEEIAKVSDIYINCAFGCSHRHTRTVKVLPQLMREAGKKVVAGSLLCDEIRSLGTFAERVRKIPQSTAIVTGGAKIVDKIEILKQFVDSKVRLIFIGGRMVNAFLLAIELEDKIDSLDISDLPKMMWENKTPEDRISLVKEVSLAHKIITRAKENGVSLVFPDDYKVTKKYEDTEYVIKKNPDFNKDFQLDLGPETIANYRKNILLDGKIKNIFWNGPLGAYDHPGTRDYAGGSVEMAKMLFAEALGNEDVLVIIGGGDSAATLKRIDIEILKGKIREVLNKQLNASINQDLLTINFMGQDGYTLYNYFSSNFFVSTGGGAALEFLESFLKQEGGADLASYLPGTSALMEMPPTPVR
jgi:phosphoglycerate kinase